MIELILLILAVVFTVVGFYYFINNFRKINKNKVESTEENEFPQDIKRSFGFILGGFLFITILSIIIVLARF